MWRCLSAMIVVCLGSCDLPPWDFVPVRLLKGHIKPLAGKSRRCMLHGLSVRDIVGGRLWPLY